MQKKSDLPPFCHCCIAEMEEQQTVLVVCPLKSIIKITEAQTIGILAASAAKMYLMKSYFQRVNVQQHFTCISVCLIWFCILTFGEEDWFKYDS